MRSATTLTGIEPGRVIAEDEFGEPFTIAADAVVLVTQRVSRDALFHELDGTLPRVYRIGDCVAPRLLAEVVFDGHRLAREIDSRIRRWRCPTCESGRCRIRRRHRPRRRRR